MRTVRLLGITALSAFACSPTPPSQPSPAQGPGGGVAAAPAGAVVANPGPLGQPGGPARRRPPSPMQQDTQRRAMVDSIRRSIAGRETEPATSVFKNVTTIKGLTAGALLTLMDEQYGRGLGWTCNNCHVIGKFDDDSRKNKKIARQMQQMQDHINGDRLTLVKELDDNYNKASCVMCHRGESHAFGEMEVLTAPPPQRRPPER